MVFVLYQLETWSNHDACEFDGGKLELIYAEQAVNLLLKTIELVPEKPDGYKFLRPLLNDRKVQSILSRWLKLIDNAPKAFGKNLHRRQSWSIHQYLVLHPTIIFIIFFCFFPRFLRPDC